MRYTQTCELECERELYLRNSFLSNKQWHYTNNASVFQENTCSSNATSMKNHD